MGQERGREKKGRAGDVFAYENNKVHLLGISILLHCRFVASSEGNILPLTSFISHMVSSHPFISHAISSCVTTFNLCVCACENLEMMKCRKRQLKCVRQTEHVQFTVLGSGKLATSGTFSKISAIMF